MSSVTSMLEVQNGDKYLDCSKYGNGMLHLLVYSDVIHRITSGLQCYLYSICTVRLQKHKLSSATVAETLNGNNIRNWLSEENVYLFHLIINKGKDTAVSLQTWSVPEGSRKLRFPDYMTTAQDGSKVVSLRHRPPLPPGNAPGTHFCYRLIRPQGHSAIGRIMSMKNSNDTIWNRTSDLPICSIVP
jgi:hypothetical protein